MRRVQHIPKVGMSIRSASSSSPTGQASSTCMFGHPIENLSHDHGCKNRGHPRSAAFVPTSWQPLHIPRYVAAKTAEPQLLCVISLGCTALAISSVIGMYRALIMVTWFSVNITFPRSHRRYSSRLRVICVAVKGTCGYPGNFWICIEQRKGISK